MQILKNIFVSFFIVCFVLFFPLFVHAEEISLYEERVHILQDGRIFVEEKITYNFGDEQRHGIFRTIPTIKIHEEGKKFVLDFVDFSVSGRHSKTMSDGIVTLKIGDPNKMISGIHVYDISYSVAGALTYFSDHDELYWNVTGDQWNVPITSAIALVQLPADVSKDNLRFACFTGDFGSTEENCVTDYDEKNREVQIQTTKPLTAYEGLTIVVGFPKGLVEVLEPKEYIPFWETFWGRAVFVILVILAFCWYIVAPLTLPFFWWKYGRDPKQVIGVASAWFEAPRGKGGRLLTPGETGTLTDERADNADITATIIDLARRGYLKIIEKPKGDIHLKKEVATVAGDTLQPFEQSLFTGMFKAKDSITLKTADLITVVTDAKNKLYDSMVDQGFFPKNPQTVRNKFAIGSVVALLTGNFPLFLSILLFGYHMPRKSIVGAAAAARARSLKNFITSQDRQFTFQAEKQMLFEKMLPFAIAFGVEKIWVARFAQMHLAKPDWYQGYSSGRFNAIVFADSLSRASSGIAKAATPVSSSTGHSSGFSGGSSGGGGGGGGGGSW